MSWTSMSDKNIFGKDSRYKRVIKNYLSYFSTKTYVVGTPKNRLNETVLLGTQNIWMS